MWTIGIKSSTPTLAVELDNLKIFFRCFGKEDFLMRRCYTSILLLDLLYSLQHLLTECKDFQEEEAAFQYLRSQMGVTVQLTPKFHAELAGEGVEYCWTQAKSHYRRVPVSGKRGRENVKQQLVNRECTCPVNVICKERVEKFSTRAQAYICTYHHLDVQELQQRGSDTTLENTTPNARPKQELLYNDIGEALESFQVSPMCP
jgi:hypothetical protein